MRNKIIYFYVFTSFFLAQFLSLEFGSIKLSLSRGSMLFLIIIFIFDTLYEKKITIYKSYSYKFIIFWFIYSVFNLAFGSYYSLSGWMQLVYLVGMYTISTIIFTRYINDVEDIKKMLFVMQLGILVQMVIGIYEHYTGIYLWTSYAELFNTHPYFQKMRYPTAMQNNPNDFALLMFFGVFISLACARLYKRRPMRTASYLMAIIGINLIIISDARAVLFGLIIALGYKFLEQSRIRSKNKLLLISLGMLLGLGLVILKADNISYFINEKLNFSHLGGSEQIRLDLIGIGLEYLFRTVGFGIGSHNLYAWHNFWLEILVESGIIVFIGFVALYIRIFMNMKRIDIMTKNNTMQIIGHSIRGILIGFVISCLGPASSLNLEWLGIMFAVFITFEKISIVQRKVESSKFKSIDSLNSSI